MKIPINMSDAQQTLQSAAIIDSVGCFQGRDSVSGRSLGLIFTSSKFNWKLSLCVSEHIYIHISILIMFPPKTQDVLFPFVFHLDLEQNSRLFTSWGTAWGVHQAFLLFELGHSCFT